MANIKDQPVDIQKNGKKVAIVGSGPSTDSKAASSC